MTENIHQLNYIHQLVIHYFGHSIVIQIKLLFFKCTNNITTYVTVCLLLIMTLLGFEPKFLSKHVESVLPLNYKVSIIFSQIQVTLPNK